MTEDAIRAVADATGLTVEHLQKLAQRTRITGPERIAPYTGRGAHDLPATDVRVPPACYLAADLPERAPVGARVSLLVRIVLTPSNARSALKSFAVPSAGAKVTICVSPRGLVAVGDLEQEVLVPPHADSEPVRFGFRTGAVGLQTVTVRAFADRTFLGELRMQMSVELGAELEE